jgi:hypothetical protein
MLTRASQETNLKLVDVARWLVAEHEDRVPPRNPEIATNPPPVIRW